MYFIGNFQHVSHQQSDTENDRRHGSFSMMVSADHMNDALDKFHLKLAEYKKSTAFFEGKCTIYITQLLEFDKFPDQEAIMLNFKSFAGDPVMPFIACVVPTEHSNSCNIHEWEQGQPVTEGQNDTIFAQFD